MRKVYCINGFSTALTESGPRNLLDTVLDAGLAIRAHSHWNRPDASEAEAVAAAVSSPGLCLMQNFVYFVEGFGVRPSTQRLAAYCIYSSTIGTI